MLQPFLKGVSPSANRLTTLAVISKEALDITLHAQNIYHCIILHETNPKLFVYKECLKL